MRNISGEEVRCIFTKEPCNLGKALPEMESRRQNANRAAELTGGVGEVAELGREKLNDNDVSLVNSIDLPLCPGCWPS
jgi:hypothetical protein